MRSQEREPHLVRAGGGGILMDMSQELLRVEIYRKSASPEFQDPHFVWKFTGKNISTLYKSHFVWKFTRKMPHPFPDPHFVWKFRGTNVDDIVQESLCVEIYKRNAAAPVPTWIEHRPFVRYRKNRFSAATVVEKKNCIFPCCFVFFS